MREVTTLEEATIRAWIRRRGLFPQLLQNAPALLLARAEAPMRG